MAIQPRETKETWDSRREEKQKTSLNAVCLLVPVGVEEFYFLITHNLIYKLESNTLKSDK